MPTKITVIYDNPTDPAAFEAGYADGQVALARALPGIVRFETSKVWPKEDGSPTPAYRMIDLYFADYESASAAVHYARSRCLLPEHLRSGDRWRPYPVQRHRRVVVGAGRFRWRPIR